MLSIQRITLSVDDQDKALVFYTATLGFIKKYVYELPEGKVVTLVSPDDPDGPELLLEAYSPEVKGADKNYQKALAEAGIPAASFLVADVKKEKQRKMTDEEGKLWGIEKLNVIRSEIPAVTHVDYSARIQTVHKDDNPLYHELITSFYKRTGCPVIVNTSFNVRGEPIVATPLDAYKCFMRTDIDILVLGNFVLQKEEQPEFHDDIMWRQTYELD